MLNFFKNKNGDLSATKIGTTTLAGLFTAASLWSGIYINEARQVSLEVRFGDVVDTVTESGLKTKVPFLTSRYAYSLARQTTEIGQGTALRTSDDVRLTNPFTIEYEIDKNADLKNLYFQLKGSGEDLQDVIQKLARDVGVRVFEGLQVTDLAEEGITDKIKTEMKTKLQADLQAKGWPVTIVDVLSDGFQLSPESEDVLERIIDIRQEKARLELREENAIKAQETLEAEAEAYVKYADVLRAAGLPDEDIRCAIHDKMAQDAGKIMTPFAQVCGTATGGFANDIAVAVDPANVTMPPVKGGAAPAPITP